MIFLYYLLVGAAHASFFKFLYNRYKFSFGKDFNDGWGYYSFMMMWPITYLLFTMAPFMVFYEWHYRNLEPRSFWQYLKDELLFERDHLTRHPD